VGFTDGAQTVSFMQFSRAAYEWGNIYDYFHRFSSILIFFFEFCKPFRSFYFGHKNKKFAEKQFRKILRESLSENKNRHFDLSAILYFQSQNASKIYF
jgi:hypothetical protein